MTTLVDRLRQATGTEGEFDIDVRDTYFSLRMAAGLIAIVLPFVLVGWGLLHAVQWQDMTSLSSFYWLSLSSPGDPNMLLRNWFVGSLIAVGACLIVYQGYGRLEDWLLNFAGLAAILVALNPMPWPPKDVFKTHEHVAPWTTPHLDPLHVHYSAAVIFFLLIAATIWFCARDTLAAVPDPVVRKRWDRIYRIWAIAMAAVPIAVYVFFSNDGHLTLGLEVAGVWVFSGYWFAKTHELMHVSFVEPPAGPAPKVKRIAGRLEVLRPSEPPPPAT